RLRAVEGDVLSVRRPTPWAAADFVGRFRELDELGEAFAEARRGAVAVMIEGESGVGKSALVRRVLERVRGEATVFAGRCYERESVPYKAVDEIVDALSRYLASLPAEEVRSLAPPNAALLAEVFPVLRAAVHDRPANGPASRPSR